MIDMAIVEDMVADRAVMQAEHHCIIENVIYESIGEDKNGTKAMQLVAEVTMNRIDDLNYYSKGETNFCDVVYARKQFSWTMMDEEDLYDYTEKDYLRAAQVVYSLIYDEVRRILPKNVFHYINYAYATDRSWYDPNKVVYTYKNHQFLRM